MEESTEANDMHEDLLTMINKQTHFLWLRSNGTKKIVVEMVVVIWM